LVANLLTIERIDAVGFVDEGANPEADILIWKRADPPATDDNISKGEANMSFDFDSLPDEARAEFETLQSRITELEGQLAAEPTENADPEEQVLKALPDEDRALIQKRIEEAEARVAKAEQAAAEAVEKANEERRERRLAEFAKQAESELDTLIGETSDKAMLLYTVHERLDKDTAKSLMEMLRAANGIAKQSDVLTKQLSSVDAEMPDTAWAEVEKQATELVTNGIKPTREQAIDHILTNDAALAARVDAER
jgi:hypothetical protein